MPSRTVICRTDDCPYNGVAIVVSIVVDDPEVPPPAFVFCGACGHVITDVTAH